MTSLQNLIWTTFLRTSLFTLQRRSLVSSFPSDTPTLCAKCFIYSKINVAVLRHTFLFPEKRVNNWVTFYSQLWAVELPRSSSYLQRSQIISEFKENDSIFSLSLFISFQSNNKLNVMLCVSLISMILWSQRCWEWMLVIRAPSASAVSSNCRSPLLLDHFPGQVDLLLQVKQDICAMFGGLLDELTNTGSNGLHCTPIPKAYLICKRSKWLNKIGKSPFVSIMSWIKSSKSMYWKLSKLVISKKVRSIPERDHMVHRL